MPFAALAAISPYGANLTVNASGDFDMSSTKLANESYLGGIDLIVGGDLNVGGQFTTFGDPGAPKGIFTTSGGNISVLANGDVNVNGSRIAAYNGGDVTIESLNGNLTAGNGGSGYVSMNALELDPLTGQLVSLPASIPGSGILATTLPGSHAQLGNILVETPRGNISASLGGVLQLSFNGTDASKAVTMLLAGYELRDAAGVNRLSAANLSADYQLVKQLGSDAPPFAFNLVNASGATIGKLPVISLARNIDASGSGVIAQNLVAKATREVGGIFISAGASDISGKQIGPIVLIGNGPITVGGDSVGPQRIIGSTDPVINGVENPVEPTAAAAPASVAQTATDAKEISKQAEGEFGDEEDKKKEGGGKGIVLAQKTGRVTVILPAKN